MTTFNSLVDNDVFLNALCDHLQNHAVARVWLDTAKPAGWAIAIDTYLATVRLLMNKAVMLQYAHTAATAIAAIERELSGSHPGRVIHAAARPDPAILGRAIGHKQVMDFWLVQLARQERCKLATLDAGTLANWPNDTLRVAAS
jgi:predicted nucleic acid-binding protein